MKLSEAETIADASLLRLKPYCERIEIAGSIRRQKPEVSDIDLVAIPKTIPIYDMFGEVISQRSLLADRKLLEGLGVVTKCGQRFAQVQLWQGISLELSMVLPPATWPVLMVIRTGPSEFSHWIVTSRSKGGALPDGWRCEDGRVWDGQVQMQFDSEEHFLDWIGIHWLEPSERMPRWNYFRRPRTGNTWGNNDTPV